MKTGTMVKQVRFVVLVLLALNAMISCERGVGALAGALVKKEIALRLIPRQPVESVVEQNEQNEQ